MNKILLFILFFTFLIGVRVQAQTYTDEIQEFRNKYIENLVAKNRIVRQKDQKQIQFYAPSEKAKVKAYFTPIVGGKPFEIPTSSGKVKEFIPHGVLSFEWDDTLVKLEVYRAVPVGVVLKKQSLFVPFKDLTNGKATYEGGRYIDLEQDDIKDGIVTIDFNKAYNPYCVFQDGWNCPIPPVVNHLLVAIDAGEKIYQGKRTKRR